MENEVKLNACLIKLFIESFMQLTTRKVTHNHVIIKIINIAYIKNSYISTYFVQWIVIV